MSSNLRAAMLWTKPRSLSENLRDVGANHAYVNVGTSHDIGEFACDRQGGFLVELSDAVSVVRNPGAGQGAA